MKMFGYYALHSFVNQVRRLLKTWIAVFFAICILFGVGIGIAGVTLGDHSDESSDASLGQVEMTEDEEEESFGREQKNQLVELIAGGVILLELGFSAFTSDKSVSSLMLPADAPILFASPRKPQTVLIFRLSLQIGAMMASSSYLLFQLPNLMRIAELSAWNGIMILVTWFFALVWGRLLRVFIYCFGSTHERFKNNLRYLLFGFFAVIGIAFYGFYKTSGQTLFASAESFFNGKYSLLVPVWGWLKAMIVFGLRQNTVLQLAAVGANVLIAAAFMYLIWQMKADYYEEALAECEETAELLASAKEGRMFFKGNEKDRSEKLLRDGLTRGFGANVYFWKSIYNRFRFAHLKYFTKTAETYLVFGVLVSLAVKYLFHASSPLAPFGILAILVFFRSLANPMREDANKSYFVLIPESTAAKLWYSLLGAMANCVLDLLPGFLAACLILQAEPLVALSWFMLILSLYYYSTNVGAFIDFSVPTSAGQIVAQLLFVFFLALPDAACILLAGVFSQLVFGLLLAVLINCVLGSVFFLLIPVLFRAERVPVNSQK